MHQNRMLSTTVRKWIPYGICLLFFLGAAFFQFDEVAIGDSLQMATSAVHAINTQQFLKEPTLYLPSAHWLYYSFLFGVSSLLGTHVVTFIRVMNWLSLISMTASFGLFYLLAKRWMRPDSALIATLMLYVSPMLFSMGVEGHPIAPSVMTALFAALAAMNAFNFGENQPRLKRILWGVSFFFLLTVSISVRAESVFFTPAIFILAVTPRHLLNDHKKIWFSRQFYWYALWTGGIIFLSGLTYLLIWNLTWASALADDMGSNTAGAQFKGVISYFSHVSNLRMAAGVIAHSIGWGLVGGFICVLWQFLRHREFYKGAAIQFILMIFVPMVIFLFNPYPSRHFIYPYIILAFFIGRAFDLSFQKIRLRRLITILGLLLMTVMINPLATWAFYDKVESVPGRSRNFNVFKWAYDTCQIHSENQGVAREFLKTFLSGGIFISSPWYLDGLFAFIADMDAVPYQRIQEGGTLDRFYQVSFGEKKLLLCTPREFNRSFSTLDYAQDQMFYIARPERFDPPIEFPIKFPRTPVAIPIEIPHEF